MNIYKTALDKLYAFVKSEKSYTSKTNLIAHFEIGSNSILEVATLDTSFSHYDFTELVKCTNNYLSLIENEF